MSYLSSSESQLEWKTELISTEGLVQDTERIYYTDDLHSSRLWASNEMFRLEGIGKKKETEQLEILYQLVT